MRKRDRILLKHMGLRAALVLGVVATGVMALRMVWGGVADMRLRAAKEMAERSLPALQVPADPAPASPAGTLLDVALTFEPLTLRPLGGQNQTFLPLRLEAAWSDQERAAFQEVLTANAERLRRLDALILNARPADQDWVTPLETPASGEGTLGDRLRLINDLCVISAVLAHRDGKHGEAVHHFQRLLAIDRLVCGNQSVAAHGVAMTTRARIVAVVERIVQDLKIQTAGSAEEGAAARGAVGQVIAALLDDRLFNAQLRTAAHYQIAALAEMKSPLDERMAAFRPEEAALGNWLLRPLLVDERRRALWAAPRWRAHIEAETYEAYRLDPYSPADDRLSRMAMSASNSYNWQWNRLVFTHFRALADARAAAALLGARMATMDAGRYPASAERLVPEYLPAAPVDPFAADGRALRYYADPTEGVTVWSVGSNGTDEGASISSSGRGRNMEQIDLVYGAGWRSGAVGPSTAPASTAPASTTAPSAGP